MEKEGKTDENVNFSHEELMEISITALNELLTQDNFLNDLPKGVTLEEVNNHIALQCGRSITIDVRKENGEKISVIVPQVECTVADLKKAIRRHVNLKLTRLPNKSKPKLISWKYIWKTYCLQYNDSLLNDNNAKLSGYGIRNKSSLNFVKIRRKR